MRAHIGRDSAENNLNLQSSSPWNRVLSVLCSIAPRLTCGSVHHWCYRRLASLEKSTVWICTGTQETRNWEAKLMTGVAFAFSFNFLQGTWWWEGRIYGRKKASNFRGVSRAEKHNGQLWDSIAALTNLYDRESSWKAGKIGLHMHAWRTCLLMVI